jgi:AbiJ-like protein
MLASRGKDSKQISEITKRDLREVLAKIKWWERLEETTFLERLYLLDEMPSYDPRYKTAEQDIYQHRMNNSARC